MSASSMTLRTKDQTTSSFLNTVLEYAKFEGTQEIRLCITKRYVSEGELPYKDFTLLQNTPLLLVAVLLKLPAVTDPLIVVIDNPGLTMQRDHSATEVRKLVEQLLIIAPPKLYYGTEPIEPTCKLPADRAGTQLLSYDFTELNDTTAKDFFRRMGSLS